MTRREEIALRFIGAGCPADAGEARDRAARAWDMATVVEEVFDGRTADNRGVPRGRGGTPAGIYRSDMGRACGDTDLVPD